MNSLRILQVIESLNPVRGGSVEAARHLSCALSEFGHRVEFVAADSAEDPYVLDFPLTVHPLGRSRLGACFCFPNSEARKNRALFFHPTLVGWIRREAPHYDCVIANGIWHFDSFAVWEALHNGPIPYVVFPHGSLAPWLNTTGKIKFAGKWIFWRLIGHRLLSDAAAVMFSCDDERSTAPEAFQPYRCHEVVVGGGIPPAPAADALQREAFLARFPDLRNKRLILSLGRITPIKGYDIAIESFAQVAHKDPSLHFVIAGPDEGYQSYLVDLTRRLGVKGRVSWTGSVSGLVKWGALRSSELLLAPSHTESFGVSIVEALACGVPVLISNKVGIRREIEMDRAGLVGDDAGDAIAQLLQRWVDLDASERREWARRALECYRRRFDIKRTAERVNAVLMECVPSARERQARVS